MQIIYRNGDFSLDLNRENRGADCTWETTVLGGNFQLLFAMIMSVIKSVKVSFVEVSELTNRSHRIPP